MKKIPMSSWLKNMFGGAKKPQKRRRIEAKSKVLPQNLERLENRTLLTTLLAVDDSDNLLTFDSATPGTIASTVGITGLGAGEEIVGIDVRPATGQLYGLGVTDDGATRTGRLYTIDTTTGVATPVGAAFSTTLSDTGDWGIDFNPVVDRLRVVSVNQENLRVNPNDGSLAGTDTNLSVNTIDSVGYTPTIGGATVTTLYTYDYNADQLATIGGINGTPSPNGGVVTDIGTTGIVASGFQNLTIDDSGTAYLSTGVGGVYGLYTLNLTTGAATLVNTISAGATPIVGLASASTTLSVVGTGGNDTLVVTATGPNTGTYSLNGGADVPFAGITSFSFLGGAGDDTLTIVNPAGSVFAPTGGIFYNGQTSTTGDSLVISGGGGATFNETYDPSSPNDGVLTTTDGVVTQTITFVGLEPVTDTATAASLTINGTAGVDTINVVDGPVYLGDQTTQVNSDTFELVNFANKGTVTINSLAGADVVTIDGNLQAVGLTTLTVNTGTEADIVNLLVNAGAVTYNINTGAGADTIHLATAQAGGLDNLPGAIVVDGGTEVDSVDLDDDLANFSDEYTVTSTTVTRVEFGGLTYSTIENLTLDAENTLGTSGNNTINVVSTATGVTTTINAQGGDDVVNVGNASNSLSDIVGPLVLDGGTLINNLHINNSGDAVGPAVTVTPAGVAIDGTVAHITATNFATVDVDVTGAVVITGDAGDNDLVVTATSATDADVQLDGGPVVHLTGVTSLTFDAGAGDDTMTINNPTGTVFGPTGGIFYNGQGQTTGDALSLLGGGGATFNETYTPSTVNNGVLVTTNGTVTQTVTFTGLEPVNDTATVASFTINGTAAADTINVVNGPVVGTDQTVQVNSDTFELVNFANKATVTVDGLDGVDVITLDNTLAAVGLTAFNVFTGITAGSQVNVHSTPAGVATTINSDGAAATVNVGNAGLLTGIAGQVQVENDFNFSNLVIDGSADAVARNATLDTTLIGAQTFGQLTGLGNTAPILYALADSTDVSAVTISAGSAGNTLLIDQDGVANNGFTTTVNTGTGSDAVNVQATSGGVTYLIHGQSGTDTVTVGSLAPVSTGGTLAGIQGNITFDNAGQFNDIIIDDSGDAVGQTATLANPVAGQGRLTGLGTTADINWVLNDTTSVVVNGGSGGNTINVNLTDAGTFHSTVVNSGTGADAVNILSSIAQLTVNAQDSDDVLTVTGAGLPAATAVNLNGDGGDDSFVITGVPTVNSDLNIDGGLQTTPDGDSITMNGANIDSIRHFLQTSSSGVIEYDSDAIDDGANESDVDYIGLEPIFDNSNAVNRVFDFGAGDDQDVVIQDVGGADGITQIAAPANAEFVNFTAPTATMTVNLGLGDDIISIDSFDAAFPAIQINVNGDSNSDEIRIGAVPTGATVNADTDSGVPDRVIVGSVAGVATSFAQFNTGVSTLDGIQGTINANDSGGVGELYVDDSGDATGRTFIQDPNAAVPVFGGDGFTLNPTHLPGFINYTESMETFQLATGSGADTVNVNGTNGDGVNTFFGNGGIDTFNILGDGLGGDNTFNGDGDNDEFNLNITNDIGVTNVQGTITSLVLDGGATTANDSANRNRATINNAGAIAALSFDWSAGGAFDTDVTGFAIDVNVVAGQTVQYNDTVGNDTVVTLIGQTTDDEITVVPTDVNEAAAFIGGDPFEDTTELPLGANLPGYAGGGTEADFSFTGLYNNFSPSGITVDGNGSAGPVGDQLFVYGQTEGGIVDPVALGAGYTIFTNLASYTAGELLHDVGVGNAYDDIFAFDSFVAVNDFVTISLDPNDFVQVDPTLTSGLIINSGDEATAGVPDPDCDGFRADSIAIFISSVIPITVNGGDPPSNGVDSQGDELEILNTFDEVQVWSDKTVPPTVTFAFFPLGGGTLLNLTVSSIECYAPITTNTVTLVGDNNDPAIDQTDDFIVVGQDVDKNFGGDADGANEFVLNINGSNDIKFTGVTQLNALGDDLTAAGDADPDTLNLTPYADYSNGGNPPSSPLGWGIDTFFNEGGVTGADDGDEQDLLVVNGVAGVSEVTAITPSDEEDGQVRVGHADGTLIANITYISNVGFIFHGNDGSAGDTDRLVLNGTDGVSPGTSGDETAVVNYDNAGNAASPFITVADTNGVGLLYSIHNITNFDIVEFNLSGGNDSVTVTDGAGAGGAGFANTTLDIELGDGNDTFNATASTTARSYTVNGGAGDDTLTGGAGVDFFYGSLGNDTIDGGDGNDTIDGGDGIDNLTGGVGNDAIYGGIGNDVILGGVGDDVLDGGDGFDTITGGVGDDTMTGGEDGDHFVLATGDGSDYIEGGSGADWVTFTSTGGAVGVDVDGNGYEITTATNDAGIYGVEELDIVGAAAANAITIGDLSGSGLEYLDITLGAAADTVSVDGENAADDITVSTPAAGEVEVDGLAYELLIETTTIADTLTVNGRQGNDTLKANAGVEAQIGIVLNGDEGDDFLSADATLNGGAGNDTLQGGAGNDTINGNDGDDTILFAAGGTDNIDGGLGFDRYVITGSNGPTTITVSQAAATVDGATQTFGTFAGMEVVLVDGQAGVDNVTVNLTTVAGVILAGYGDDVVNGAGSTAPLTIDGGLGNDTITGGSAIDFLHGDEGNDTITGGAGADQMSGGDGTDTFFWSPGDGSDVITGGDDGADSLVFNGNASANDFTLAALDGHFTLALGAATVNTTGVEHVQLNALAGNDTVVIGDLSTTEITSMNVDLGVGDTDSVTVNGTTTGDNLAVTAPSGTTLKVQGLTYDLNIANVVKANSDALVVNGNEGDDTIKANAGVDAAVLITFNGNDGNDFLSADATLNGGNGDDTLVGGVGDDTLDGGAGDDLLTGGTGIDSFTGGGGYDTIVETRNADFTLTNTTLVIGAEGTDTLTDLIENAILSGRQSPNVFTIGAFSGDTTIDGAGGSDTVDFSTATQAIHIDLDAVGQDQIINFAGRTIVFADVIENLTATPFNDTINVDIAQFNRFIDGGIEDSIPPGDRLNVDLLGSNATSTKVPNGKLGSFDGTVNGSGFTGTISYVDIETLVIKGANSTPPDFSAAVQYDMGDGPRGVITADFDGDGILDMATANSLSNDISVRLGDGFGNFGAVTTYSAGGKKAKQTTTIAGGDVDGDGDIDLVVTNRKTNNVSVLLGNGDGTFGAATLYDTGVKKSGKFPTAVKLGDMDGDGNLDIVTANSNVGKNGSFSILLGDGAGSFGTANVTATKGRRPRDLVLIDVDTDGNLDVVATNLFSKSVFVLNGDGAGGLGAPTSIDVAIMPNSIIEGDFNGDGILDVVTTSLISPRLSLLLGNGTGFDPVKEIKYPATKLDISINTADINGDGNLDLLIANRNDNTLSYMLGNGNGSFQNRVDFKTGNTIFREPVSIAVGDFNNDGAIDLMVANAASDDVSVLIHVGIV